MIRTKKKVSSCAAAKWGVPGSLGPFETDPAIDFDDPHWRTRAYDPPAAYSQANLAKSLLSRVSQVN